MWQYTLKVIVTAIIVVCIAEVSKRWTLLGAITASLPLTSILAMIWLYIDTSDIEKINSLSLSIFWVVIPSILFFLLLPAFDKLGLNFWMSLGASCFCTACVYWVYIKAIEKIGVRLS